MKKVYQVQVNPLNCGWMEIETYEDRTKADEVLEKTKKRNNGNPDFEHRIIEITVNE